MPRRNPKPSRQTSLDYEHYARLIQDLRNCRAQRPIDESEEDRILDQMDVVWARMSSQDQVKIEKRFGSRGK